MTILRRLMRVLLLALVLVSVPPLLLLSASMSESGSAWLLQQVARVAPSMGTELELQHESGSLLDELRLRSVRFDGFGFGFSAGRVVLQWSPGALLDRTLLVRALELRDVSLVLPPADDSASRPPEIPSLSLPIALHLERLDIEGFRLVQGDGEQRFAALSLSAQADDRRIEVQSIDLQMAGAELVGELAMQSIAPHAIGGHLAVDLAAELTGEDVGPVSAVVELAGEALMPRIDLTLSRPRVLRVQGRLQLDRSEPGFDLLAEWPRLGWPLSGEEIVRASKGRLAVKGGVDDYRIELSAQLQREGLPPGSLRTSANGNLQGLQLRQLSLDMLGGRLLATGMLEWERLPRWDLLVEAQAIDPGLYLDEWAGRLDGRVQIRGGLAPAADGGLRLQVGIDELSGVLRDQPFRAGGRLTLTGDRLHAEQLQVLSGSNRVFVSGDAGDRLDLTFSVDAPDLEAFHPGLAGLLKGEGRVAGRRDMPNVVASLEGENLDYQGSRVAALQLDIDWQENGGKASLRVNGLETAAQKVGEVTAQVSGSPAAHRITASAITGTAAVALAADGGLQGETWQGRMSQFDLKENRLGAWGLERPVLLKLARQAVRAERFCLAQGETRVCAAGGWDASAGLDVAASLVDLDLGPLATYLSGEAEFVGRLDGALEAKGPLQKPRVRFELLPGDGMVRLEQEVQPLEVSYRDARLEGVFENDQGRAQLHFELGDQGRAQGNLSLGPERAGQRALFGRISADFPDLGLLAGFVPELEQVTGRLHLESDLAGTLASPEVSGRLQVLEASARLPAAGISFSEIGLDLDAVGGAPVRVRGGMRSGEGRLAVEGEIDPWSAAGTRVDLRVFGENFQVARLPEALVEISPELHLKGAGPYHLGGVLKIPRSKIELRELPRTTVSVSDDEIVVGEQDEVPPQTTPANLTVGVRVELGDEVSFRGFGLETGLTGSVDARTGGGDTRMDGKIELRDARYAAYGQELEVEQGRLIFTGVPSNPEVDLRAVRESFDGRVRAFLAVSGPLSRPRSRVYSEPALPDAEALAYLLTGRGLDQAGRGEGVDIASAALALGMSKGDPLLQDLGDRFGLDELSLESGSSGIEDSSLLLGKYLNPDLYLGYSQSLFNPEGAVLLRLRLRERLELESRSGREQSVDLFYRLEHD